MAQGAAYAPRRRKRLWVNAAAISLILLVSVGAVAALALNDGLGLLGGSEQRPADNPANVPAREDNERPGEGSTTEPTTSPSSEPNPDEERLEEFGYEYDEANRRGDWEETYSMLSESSQQEFTEEEWAEKQQAIRDANGTPAPLESVTVELEETMSDAPGTVTLNYQDGTQEDLTVTTFRAVTDPNDDGGPRRILTEE